MRSNHTPIAILGAGLTGMNAALSLGDDQVPHRIFEKLDLPGGHAVTRIERDYASTGRAISCTCEIRGSGAGCSSGSVKSTTWFSAAA